MQGFAKLSLNLDFRESLNIQILEQEYRGLNQNPKGRQGKEDPMRLSWAMLEAGALSLSKSTR
jgi:hypothetical protein